MTRDPEDSLRRTQTVLDGETIRLPSRNGGSTPYLAEYTPFAGLSVDQVRAIEKLADKRTFAPGQALMRQGGPGDSLMIVLAGTVEVDVREGDNRHVLRQAGRGEVMGEMALLTGEPRTANVTAMTGVSALVLAAADFHRFAQQHPDISVVLTQLVARRLGGATHDALSGKQFHGYRIRRRLGRGGMGLVYEAEDESGQRVALKMMSHRLVYDESASLQFQHEADIIQSLDHPNITRLLGRFTAFHTYFIVMEYVDGLDLKQILQLRGRLEEDEVRRILGQLVQAISCAHSADIVHRDIKPSNVMVATDGTVKLMDFGLARNLAGAAGEGCGGLYGTLQYMAPEQLSRQVVGQAADFYALGLVAHEMLTGAPVLSIDDIQVLFSADNDWEPPRSPAGVGEELGRVLAGWLAKQPEHRKPETRRVASWSGGLDYDALSKSGPGEAGESPR